MHSLRVPPRDMHASINGTHGGVAGKCPDSDTISGRWSSGADAPDSNQGWQAPSDMERTMMIGMRTGDHSSGGTTA